MLHGKIISCQAGAIHTHKRRQFILLLGGAVGEWPTTGWGQTAQFRRVGVLMTGSRESSLPLLEALKN